MSSPEAAAPEAPEEQAPAVDEVRQGMLDTLTAELGDAIVGSQIEKGDLWVRVRPDAWRRAAEVCCAALACDYFCFLSGIDWQPSSVPNPEEAAAATPIEGVEPDEADTGEDDAGEPEPEAATATEDTDGLRTGYAGGDTRLKRLVSLGGSMNAPSRYTSMTPRRSGTF